MTADRLPLGVIVGSNRRGRFADTVARWFVGEAERRPEVTLDVIDLADVELPARFEFRTQDPRVLAFLEPGLGQLDQVEQVVGPVVDVAVGHEQRPVGRHVPDEPDVVADDQHRPAPAGQRSGHRLA